MIILTSTDESLIAIDEKKVFKLSEGKNCTVVTLEAGGFRYTTECVKDSLESCVNKINNPRAE